MKRRLGLTIIELIVVLAIIGLLVSLLFPAVQSARERARETVCKNNLHQLNLAVGQFAEAQKRLPPPGHPDLIGGWTVEILPFLEQKNLRESIVPGTSIVDAPDFLLRQPPIMRCPRRDALDIIPDNTMSSAHYVLIPTSRRDSFLLFDAPVQLDVPWASGPEMTYNDVVHSTGPHHGGSYYSRGFQQGISFMLGGEDIR